MNIDDEVETRIAKGSSAFGRIRYSVWERGGIKQATKLKVYQAVVLPTLLYACETWTVCERHAKILHRFHMNCLRKLQTINWQDKVPDTEVLSRADLPIVYTLLRKAQVRLFYGELAEGNCLRGGQGKRYKNTLEDHSREIRDKLRHL